MKVASILKTIWTKSRILTARMGTFVSDVNPVTGKTEWIVQEDDYDYQQEVARSAYADMLHDTERNKKYDVALQRAVSELHQRGREARVLDIGTGSGLLSMMAVRSGADSVTACEAFSPMAACAQTVFADNNMSSKVQLVPKRSTELKVGSGLDMEQRANILVTEVFDTELIGEGAIETFFHAHKELLEDDCIVVPQSATMFAQVVSSEFIKSWNKFQPIAIPGGDYVIPPTEINQCRGTPGVHDLQLDQLTSDKFTALCEPIKVFKFDYTGKSKIKFYEQGESGMTALTGGSCDAVFMWWELQMDAMTTLSCAPHWSHPHPDDMQWRDHWMQSVYYPATLLTVEKGQEFTLRSYHDDYSVWFDVTPPDTVGSVAPPACQCGAHVACSRTRVAQLHDNHRNKLYIEALRQTLTPDSVCISLGDSSLLPLIAARLGAKHVFCLEDHPMSRRMMRDYIAANKLQHKITVLDKNPEELTVEDLKGNKATVLLGEPFFSSCVLPWQNIYFWYARTELSRHLGSLLPKTRPSVLPGKATLRAIAVEFKDLWKIRAPVVNCEGFNLEAFDELVQGATDKADAFTEPQPLWEYPGLPMTEVFQLATFDFSSPLVGIQNLERKGYIPFCSGGTVNGVAIWMEYYLTDSLIVSTGLLQPPSPSSPLQWDPYTRQGVHLFPKPVTIPENSTKHQLHYRFTFKPKTGDINFEFSTIS